MQHNVLVVELGRSHGGLRLWLGPTGAPFLKDDAGRFR
jgi:hypothetical protein